MLDISKSAALGSIISWMVSASSSAGLAQEKVILFENIFSGKQVMLKAGDEVHLRFRVRDTSDIILDVAIADVTVMGKIEEVGDSNILLATKNKWFDRTTVVMPLYSIEAFRKYSPLRPVTKAASTIGASAVGLLATIGISTSDDVFSWGNAGLAIGAGSAVYLSRELFSDKMKCYTSEGWRCQVVNATNRKWFSFLSRNQGDYSLNITDSNR
jgi:hypothetical protein